ncbi:hypothetical protein WA026_014979 [Henosepilachna vigintioctopunctata]|uniref:Uncharacterized protein n=1 Tax=Henosepilachna vigintioctopunctata TaxID=420089 RepID=A0AAW1U7W2_9CUCU
MGHSPSSPPKPVEPPVELHVFKELDGVPMEFSIPEIPEKRKPTDQFFLIVFFVLLGIMMGCCIYTLCYSDLNRVTRGYDNCGNVCGEKNPLIEGINCTGKDFTEEKILMYTDESALKNLDYLDTQPNECVNYCDDYNI